MSAEIKIPRDIRCPKCGKIMLAHYDAPGNDTPILTMECLECTIDLTWAYNKDDISEKTGKRAIWRAMNGIKDTSHVFEKIEETGHSIEE